MRDSTVLMSHQLASYCFQNVRLFVARDCFRLTGALRCLRQDGRRGGAAEVTQRQHGEEVGRDIGEVREEDEMCDMNNKDVRTRERDE